MWSTVKLNNRGRTEKRTINLASVSHIMLYDILKKIGKIIKSEPVITIVKLITVNSARKCIRMHKPFQLFEHL